MEPSEDFSNLTTEFLIASCAAIDAQCEKLNEKKKIILTETLRRYYGTVDEWISSLSDPDIPNVGQDFQARLRDSKCKHEIDLKLGCTAAHHFLYRWSSGALESTMTYGAGALNGPERLFYSKVHETEHVLQRRRSAALNTTPFQGGKIVICPDDALLVEERCEEGANVRQAWFATLLARQMNLNPDLVKHDNYLPDQFAAQRRACGSLQDALTAAAKETLKKSYYWDNPESSYRFAQYYQDIALDNYQKGINERFYKGDKDFIFVRLEPEDIWEIGLMHPGLNCFGTNPHDPALLEKSPIMPMTHMKLRYLNDALGIPARKDELLTLREALEMQGITKGQFLRNIFTPHGGTNATPSAAVA